MNKFICILFTLSFILVSSLPSFAFSSEKLDEKPRQFVILVHGIGGKPADFGYFVEAFLPQARKLRPDLSFEVTKFRYDTGNDLKTTEDFSHDLVSFLKDFVKAHGGLRDSDRISFVSHSQGGLVIFRFMVGSFGGEKNYFPELSSHIDSFITMATPYGGTKIALLAAFLKPDKGFQIPFFINHFGKKELRDMSYGSDTVYNLHHSILDPKNQEIYQRITDQVRSLEIAGAVQHFNVVPLLTNGFNFYDSDFAVPVPSSHLDFIYNKDQEGSSFGKTTLIKKENYHVVDALHFSILPHSFITAGINYVPKHCVVDDLEDCKHPTFPMVASFLLNVPHENNDAKSRLTAFGLDVHVTVDGQEIDQSKFSVDVRAVGDSSGWIDLNRFGDFYHKVERWSGPLDYRYYTTGYFSSFYNPNTAQLRVRISAPGYNTREIVAPVERGLTTFLDLSLSAK